MESAYQWLRASVGCAFNTSAYRRNLMCQFTCQPMGYYTVSACCNVCCCPCKTADLVLHPLCAEGMSSDDLLARRVLDEQPHQQDTQEERPRRQQRVPEETLKDALRHERFMCSQHVASALVYAGIFPRSVDPRRISFSELVRRVESMRESTREKVTFVKV